MKKKNSSGRSEMDQGEQMNYFDILPWSDNWWLEDNKAWFIIGARSILCCFNLDSGEFELMAKIPDESSDRFRAVSKCMKYQNEIYCFPIYGNSIWVYSLKHDSFSEITINKPNKQHLQIHDFWEFDGKIFAVSMGLNQILAIDINEKRIQDYYILCSEGNIARSTKAGTAIFSVSGIYEKVYKFDLITKEVMTYKLPRLGRKYNTICYDGGFFWLGGYRKEIYLWNEEKNEIDKYPFRFQTICQDECKGNKNEDADHIENEYETPTFLYLTAVGKYSWHIPFQGDRIIYVDKETHKMYMFGEIESQEGSFSGGEFKAKYILEYVRKNRYLGIFSLDNNRMLEIDAEKLTYQWCNYYIGDRYLQKYGKIVERELYEINAWDREVYEKMVRWNDRSIDSRESDKVGTAIYRETNK